MLSIYVLTAIATCMVFHPCPLLTLSSYIMLRNTDRSGGYHADLTTHGYTTVHFTS